MSDERDREKRDALDNETLRRTQRTNMPRGGPGARFAMGKIELKDAKGVMLRLLTYLAARKWLLILSMLFSTVSIIVTIIGTRMIGVATDTFIAHKDKAGLASMLTMMAGMYLFCFILTFAQSRMMIWVSQNTTASIRQDLFAKQSALPIRYFDITPSGDLMSRLTNDIDQINMALSQNLSQFFHGVVSIGGTLIAMLLLSPVMTLVAMVMMPVMFLLTKALSRYTRRIYVRQQSALGELNGFVEETLSGQKAVLLFGRHDSVMSKFSQVNDRLIKSGYSTFISTGLLLPVIMLINNFCFLLSAVLGGYLIIQGSVSPGVVFTFLIYMRNFARPLNELANMFTMMQGALAGAERVFEVMDQEGELDKPGAGELGEIDGHVVMENADFSYIPGKPVIFGSSLRARPGEMTALVGPTGAGKTTLISLLARFYDLDRGHIRVDGRDLSEVTRASVRKNTGIVLQDTFLFSETVRDNIRYGRPDATDEDVIEAAKMAGIHGFISRMPKGYDTVLADNGENFSQGQRQLLSIARVILTQPSILILDEATSSVDTRTEIRIQSALLKIMEGKTSFVIAHRLSTIKNADQILVVNDGRIIERGTHQELLDLDGFYANLYNSQFRTGLVE
jgi:ATP-binding cassette subfamily B protein